MVTDPIALQGLQEEWAGVRLMRQRMQSLCVTTFADGAISATALPKIVYNLPLLLAFDVLRQVLRQLRNERKFTCPQSQLGSLVEASKAALPWLDWQAVRDGVHRRNGVAHDGELFDSDTCLADITRIEQQLIAWGVIDAA